MPRRLRAQSNAQAGAAVYARTSLPRQKTAPEQVELCRQRATQLGEKVRYVLQEHGESAKTTARPKLQHLMALCAEGRVSVIIVWKLDRLVRSLKDLLNMHDFLEQHGVSLVSITENFDTSTAFGRFAFRSLASAGELEREIIAERAQLGKLRQARAGRWPTQRPPFGFRLTRNRALSKYEPEAKIVRQIFAWYNQNLALTEISFRLAKRGVLTPMGRTFSAGAVHALVRNPIYKGRLEILDIVHNMPELRIVTPKTWEKAQQPRRAKKEGAKERRQAAIDSVFRAYLDALADGSPSDVGDQALDVAWAVPRSAAVAT